MLIKNIFISSIWKPTAKKHFLLHFITTGNGIQSTVLLKTTACKLNREGFKMFLKFVFYLFVFNLIWLFATCPGLLNNNQDNYSCYLHRLNLQNNSKKTPAPSPAPGSSSSRSTRRL